ncbi:MAG: hypothetical protein VXU42_06030, partial [Verrucomicrobiota bacterium]|nr:hypothetical protein [Verrucomicrobiota bacterium]
MESHEGRTGIQRGGRPIGSGQLQDGHGGRLRAIGAWRRDVVSPGVCGSRIWDGNSEWWRKRPGRDGCDIYAQAGTLQTASAWAEHLGNLRGLEKGIPLNPETCVIRCAAKVWRAAAFYTGLEAFLHGPDGSCDAGSEHVLRHAGRGDGGSRRVPVVPDVICPGDAGGVRIGGALVERGAVLQDVPGQVMPDCAGEVSVAERDLMPGFCRMGVALHGRHVGSGGFTRKLADEPEHVRPDSKGVWVRDACRDAWLRLKDESDDGARGEEQGCAKFEPTGSGRWE